MLLSAKAESFIGSMAAPSPNDQPPLLTPVAKIAIEAEPTSIFPLVVPLLRKSKRLPSFPVLFATITAF